MTMLAKYCNRVIYSKSKIIIIYQNYENNIYIALWR